MNRIKHFFVNYGILIVVIVFVIIIKSPHLLLPYSWDEAWSYLPALIEMVEKGPSLITGSLHLFSSKGHPLFFYFMNSGWVRIFAGDMSQIMLVRLFPLFVSIVLLVCLFFVARKHSSVKVANFSVALLSVQSLFLAQASLILPEMLLALMLLISFHFFVLNKFVWYAISASLMVLTKETGLVFAAGFGLFYLYDNKIIFPKNENITKLLLLCIPLLIFCIHLLLNFKAYHTFFFTEHLEYITFDPIQIKRILKSSTGILFTMYGRSIISGIAILSILFILFRKENFEHGKLLVLIGFQILLLILFTSVNFYTYRYILPAFPLFIMFCIIIFDQAFEKHKVFQYILIIVMIIFPLYFSITKKGKTDIDFGYASYLPLQKEMVIYCEQQNWYDKNFATEFNMLFAMRDTFTGYLTSDKGFNAYYNPNFADVDIVILDSTGEHTVLPEDQKDNFKLIKRFEHKYNWGEIYIRK